MNTIDRASGVRVAIPDTYEVADLSMAPARVLRRAAPARPSGPVRLPSPGVGSTLEQAVLLDALTGQELELVDRMRLEPREEPAVPSGRRRARVPRVPATQTMRLDIDLDNNEDAVVLTEQEGVYSWSLPSASRPRSVPRATARRGGRSAPAGKRVVFEIRIHASSTKTHRVDRRGFVQDLVFGQIKVFVLKFAARIVVGQTMKYLERRVRTGLVAVGSSDPASWAPLDGSTSLRLPSGRPARVLLLVHGTFSSTVGSFGALGATPWGQALLDGALSSYDLVIGFDHRSLSEDPLGNATELLEQLQALRFKQLPVIDIIAHSRGGLVVRSLIEHLIPVSAWRPRFERVVLVASTNAGTHLAEPDNWRLLLDLYTNLAVAAFRVVSLIPQATAAGMVLAGLVESLGAFAKYLATHTVGEGGVPGLAAMEPDGAFVTTLNQVESGRASPGGSLYAVTSDFEGSLEREGRAVEGLPRRLLTAIADGLVDQLMGASNDLVVDTASMVAVPPAIWGIKDRFDFGINPRVYHTTYFTRPEVANALARWLHLVEPAAANGGGGAPAPRRRAPTAEPLEVLEPGAVIAGDLPVMIDTDVMLAEASAPAGEVRAAAAEQTPSWVVVRRSPEEGGYVYAYTTTELLDAISSDELREPLDQVLGLRETTASGERSATTPPGLSRSMNEAPTARREVVFDGPQPVGVLPDASDLPDLHTLPESAARVLQPQSPGDRGLRRRVMPSFPRAAGTTRQRRPAAGTAPRTVTNHFHAEMYDRVIVRRVTTIEVTVSREVIGRPVGRAAAAEQAEVDPERKVVVQVIPKRHFEVVGDDRAEIDPPTSGEKQTLYFDVRPTHVGDGEVWVVGRQGQVPLVTLALKPEIVARDGQAATMVPVDAVTGPAPVLSRSLHQLRITEQQRGTETLYQYDLESPELDILDRYESARFTGDRQEYVAKLYKEIEDRWIGSDSDVEAFTEELRSFGGQLFDELFPDPLRRQLWDNREKLKSIMVISTEPFIPWELVHLKAGPSLPDETRFLGQMGLVRWLHQAGWPPEALRARRRRVRVVVPDYPHPDYELPEAQLEREFLQQQLGGLLVPPESNALRKLLREPGTFDVLHFAGHAFADQDNISNAQLLLEGRVEGDEYLPAYFSATTVEQISRLRGPDRTRPLVVLNACQAGRAGYKLTGVGGFAQAFLKGGAGAFASSMWSVLDSPARVFTESFYTALLGGRNITEAVVGARERAREAGDATWLAYVVYAHPHATLVR